MSEPYKIKLDSYSGPLDLLLFLIRREEVDIYDIPISKVTEQYLKYVELLKALDPNHIGEFLVMASTLMEIKSRMLLPKPPPEEGGEEEVVDPRLELVRQLLEYKKFKDVARDLGTAAELRAQRFGRLPATLNDEEPEVDLDQVQIWDLLSAFDRLLVQIGMKGFKHEVVYDDKPLALHAADISRRLNGAERSMRFEQIFEGRPKGEIIGLFLALLELIRAKRVRVEQDATDRSIVVHLLDPRPLIESEIRTSNDLSEQ